MGISQRSVRHLWVLLILAMVTFGIYRFGGLALFALTTAQKENIPKETIILVKRGLGPGNLSRLLESEGAISSSSQFMRLGRLLRMWGEIKAGEYSVSNQQTPIEIFSVLTSGKSIQYPITFQEGINMYQIASQLEEKGLGNRQTLLQLMKDRDFMRDLGLGEPPPPSLEGYLFPDTYLLNRTMDEKQIVTLMVRGFTSRWRPSWTERAEELKLSRHQVVTLASMIEKETGAGEERPLIGSVFHNRLKKRMRLQSDPTTIYGVWENFDGNLRRSHLLEKNSYNTYAIYGLPVGAIANPGEKAIEAALFPDRSEYLFFVSRNDGTHYFSKTVKEHNQAVRDYQINRAARKGKSWRDLGKRQE